MLPIIKFSVDFGNTLHQPASVIRAGGPTIDPALLTPLLVMAVGFTLMFVAMHLKAMRNEIMRRRVKALQLAEVERGAIGSAGGGGVGAWTSASIWDRTRASSGRPTAWSCW